MTGWRFGGGRLLALLLALTVGPALAEGSVQPAELPPSDYAGLQYVDSKGCVFLRAGVEGEVLWVPRVTPGGKLVCGYPPSGRRVPVAGDEAANESASAPESAAPEAAAPVSAAPQGVESAAETSPPESPPVTADEAETAASYVVALGSFGFPSNVEKAKVAAASLGYAVLTGQIKSGEQGLVTVFAGPFEGKSKAEDALRQLHEAGYPDAVLMRY